MGKSYVIMKDGPNELDYKISIFIRLGIVVVQEECSATKRSFACYSIKWQENSYNGRHPIHWYIFVKTPCQGGASGICLDSKSSIPLFVYYQILQ